MCVLPGRQICTFPAAGNQMREWPVSHYSHGRGNGPLEENISDKIYRPEQLSGQVQRPTERMQLPPKASASLCFPGDTLIETYSSAWRTKTERNYKNDQNGAVHWSPNETKLPVSRNAACPLGSGKQGAPQAFKLGL